MSEGRGMFRWIGKSGAAMVAHNLAAVALRGMAWLMTPAQRPVCPPFQPLPELDRRRSLPLLASPTFDHLREAAARVRDRVTTAHEEEERHGISWNAPLFRVARQVEGMRIAPLTRQERVGVLGGLASCDHAVNGVFVLTILGAMQRAGLMCQEMADELECTIIRIANERYRSDRTLWQTFYVPPFGRVSLDPDADWMFVLAYLRAYAFSQSKMAEMNRVEAQVLIDVTSHGELA